MTNLLLASNALLLLAVFFLVRRDRLVRIARRQHKRLPR
jgi:hypothetical protein